ncbi:MAG: hypothetical protein AB8H79_02980 [Myxococcota bacterium]
MLRTPLLLLAALTVVSPACKKEATKPTSTARASISAKSAAPLVSLLSARHRDDLPDRNTLDQHADAHATLMWIIESDNRGIVKNRAMQLLGAYPDRVAEHATMLDTYSATTAPHPFIRTAALRAWSQHPVADRQARVGLFEAASIDPDPRVKAAGRAAMVGLTATTKLE